MDKGENANTLLYQAGQNRGLIDETLAKKPSIQLIKDPNTGEQIAILPSGKRKPVEHTKIGVLSNLQLENELHGRNVVFTNITRQILKNLKPRLEPSILTTICLNIRGANRGYNTTNTSVREFFGTFEHGRSLKNGKIHELDLAFCLPEHGIYYLLEHGDQLSGKWLLVAMEPLLDNDKNLRIFKMRLKDGVLELGNNLADPNHSLNPGFTFLLHIPHPELLANPNLQKLTLPLP